MAVTLTTNTRLLIAKLAKESKTDESEYLLHLLLAQYKVVFKKPYLI